MKHIHCKNSKDSEFLNLVSTLTLFSIDVSQIAQMAQIE